MYGPNEEAALVKVWKLSGFLASKRLAPFLPEFLDTLQRHNELTLPKLVDERLRKISASSIDRLLRRHRSSHPRSPSFTKQGPLKRQVALRRGTDWDDAKPGYCEVDTVAHSGGDMSGDFYWTLSVTDVCTGWYEGAALRSKSQSETLRHIQSIRARLPFELLGIDSDNGGEFMNYHLLKFCQDEKIVFTRCRPYVKNDQCRVEQKNNSIVRRNTGYGRYDRAEQFKLLTEIHGILRLLVNYFEPSLKGKEKAATPYRRLLQTKTLTEPKLQELEDIYKILNPVKLREQLNRAKLKLYELNSLVEFVEQQQEHG
ncbi:MAG: transposase family protein [Candidatus Pacebacteria bacterium]|nr:transposase family protein [Candidatus Paceibacterota bacterium]